MNSYKLKDGHTVEIGIMVYPSADWKKTSDYYWWYRINNDEWVGFKTNELDNKSIEEYLSQFNTIEEFLLTIKSNHCFHKEMVDKYCIVF